MGLQRRWLAVAVAATVAAAQRRRRGSGGGGVAWMRCGAAAAAIYGGGWLWLGEGGGGRRVGVDLGMRAPAGLCGGGGAGRPGSAGPSAQSGAHNFF